MIKVVDHILDKIFEEFEKMQNNKKKMVLNFIILYLMIFCLIGIAYNEYITIKKYQSLMKSYNEKLELINDNIQITRIILESQANKDNTTKQIVETLEKYFKDKH